MGRKFGNYLGILLLFTSLQSCIEQQNFDQFDDLRIQPTLEGSILYVEAPEEIINSARTPNFYGQHFNFDGFSEAFFADRVIDGVLTYIVENTTATSNPLTITIEFLDENENILDTEVIEIEPAPPASIVEREIIYGDSGKSLEIIKNTAGLQVTCEKAHNDISSSSLMDPMVKIKSSGKFRLSVK